MIVNRVQEVAREKGLTSALQLAGHVGIAYHTAYALWQGNAARIGFRIMERICKGLGVQPGDLFVLVESEETSTLQERLQYVEE